MKVYPRKPAFISVVLVLALALALSAQRAEANKFDDFMTELKSAPGVITAFREGMTLWVQVPGSSEYQARGQEFADMISSWYTRAVGGSICVRVFYGDRRTIGKTCN